MVVGGLPHSGDRAPDGNNDVDIHTNKFSCDFRVALGATLRPTILDRDSAVLDPAEFAQSRHEGIRPWSKGRWIGTEEPYGGQLSDLLRARGERPCCRRADRQRDKFASPHLPPAERHSNYLKLARLLNEPVCDIKHSW